MNLIPKSDSKPFPILVLIFLLMGTAIILITPFNQFPDEDSHLHYAKFLRTEHRLPPMKMNPQQMPSNEGFQPPLYYMLASLFLFPGIHETAQIDLLRFFSLALATLSVWLIYKTAGLIFPDSRFFPLVCAAVAALNPQFLYINCGIGNYSATTLFGSLTIYLAMLSGISERAQHRGRDVRATFVEPKFSAFLGVAFGLAILSRTLTFCLLPLCLVALWINKHQWRDLLASIAIFGFCAAAVGGWWYVYNWIHYGDPVAWRIYAATMGNPWMRAEPYNLFYLIKSVAWLHAYFWIYFGNAAYHAGITEYVIYMILEVLAAVGLFESWRKRNQKEKRGLGLLLVAAALGFVSVMVLQYRITSPQGRYLFMVMCAIASLIGTGLLSLFPARLEKRGAFCVIAIFFLMCAYSLIRYWLPHYL